MNSPIDVRPYLSTPLRSKDLSTSMIFTNSKFQSLKYRLSKLIDLHTHSSNCGR